MEDYPASAVNQVKKPLKPYATEQKRLFLIACMFGVGLLLYVVGNNVISMFLTRNPLILNRFMNDELFSVAVGMVNTSFSVFVPFFIVYRLMRKRNMMPELPLGGVHDSMDAALLVFIGFGGCYLANIVTSYLSLFMAAFGIESLTMQYQPEPAPVTPVAILLQLLGYAVLPALFEEFAYRGVVLQSLRRYGDWFAIIMSAFLFGLLHGNLVQVPFAFIVGIILGYCTVVSGSIWVGIAIHFGNNLLSVLQSILQSAYGEDAAYTCIAAVMMSLFLIGIGCLIAFARRHKHMLRLYPSRFRFMPHRVALVLLAPTVLIACSYFLYATLMDIDGFYEWFTKGISNLFYFSIGA